jgi:peptidoglycan LD-endopeptidase LytH
MIGFKTIQRIGISGTAVVFLLVTACSKEIVEEPFEPRQSYSNYREALTRLELQDTAMGSAWISAGRTRTADPASIALPYREVMVFDPQTPDAAALYFPVSRGRHVQIEIDAEHDHYFADVLRVPDGNLTAPDEFVVVAERSPREGRIEFESRSNSYYVLRIQPELLRGGRFDLTIRESASLAFPVEGTGPEDIWSFFGDNRDGGARIHHGVDIFAPRGTPVLAGGDARVLRVGQRDLGGNIVVLQDELRDILLYYAHLDEQIAVQGRRVVAGEVIGTVGNTGNAITTPPHLHIGIYQGSWRNPVDPWPYFVQPPVVTPPAVSREETVGQWARVAEETAAYNFVTFSHSVPRSPQNRNPYLRGAGDTFAGAEAAADESFPSPPEPRSMTAPRHAPVRIVGITGEIARVRTVTGAVVFLPLDSLAFTPSDEVIPGSVALRDIETGDIIAVSDDTAGLQVVGEVAGRTVVRRQDGRTAFMDSLDRS